MRNKNTWTKTNRQQTTQSNIYQPGPPQGTKRYRQRSRPKFFVPPVQKRVD